MTAATKYAALTKSVQALITGAGWRPADRRDTAAMVARCALIALWNADPADAERVARALAGEIRRLNSRPAA